MAARTKNKQKAIELPSTFVPRIWESVDGRYAIGKVIKSRYEALREDTNASSAQRDILCQRAVFLALCLETQEIEAATTGKFDSGSYTQMSNALLGLLKALGLDQKVKKVGDLKDYLDARAG